MTDHRALPQHGNPVTANTYHHPALNLLQGQVRHIVFLTASLYHSSLASYHVYRPLGPLCDLPMWLVTTRTASIGRVYLTRWEM
jgi:hypothetical protein